MKKIFLLTILFSQLCMAALNGEWVGWGQWSYDNSAVSCNPMKMTWQENEKILAITKGLFECELLVMHLGKTEWTKKDGHLFDENDKDVGTYSADEISLYMPSPNENTTIHIQVKKTRPTSYDYQEVWFNKNEKLYVITGRFFNGSN